MIFSDQYETIDEIKSRTGLQTGAVLGFIRDALKKHAVDGRLPDHEGGPTRWRRKPAIAPNEQASAALES